MQADYVHRCTRKQNGERRARQRAQQRKRLTRGGVSARASKAEGDKQPKKRRATWANQRGGKAGKRDTAANASGTTRDATDTDNKRHQPEKKKGTRRSASTAEAPAARRRRTQPAADGAPARGRKRTATSTASPRRKPPPRPTRQGEADATPEAAPAPAALGTTGAAAENTPPSLSAAERRMAAMRARVIARQSAGAAATP